jgi:hypothetical protein
MIGWTHHAGSIFAAAIAMALSGTGATAAAERLPTAFHGAWTSDLAECGTRGESTPTVIDGRHILQYESGWTIRSWSRRGDVWVGRGTAGDDQGETPATVRLRLRADGKLDFDNGARGPFNAGPGWVRCPTPPGAGR